MSDSLQQQGKALENQFFAQVDQKLLAKLRENMEKIPRREQLARVTNIQNVAVLDKLLELGIDADTFAAITYVPLAAVAWSDGAIDATERQAVLDAALQHGAKRDGVGYALLEKWLTQPPGPELLQAWRAYIHELKSSADPAWMKSLRTEIMGMAEKVAEASGGILGLVQKVSTSEKRKLDELAKAFDT